MSINVHGAGAAEIDGSNILPAVIGATVIAAIATVAFICWRAYTIRRATRNQGLQDITVVAYLFRSFIIAEMPTARILLYLCGGQLVASDGSLATPARLSELERRHA